MLHDSKANKIFLLVLVVVLALGAAAKPLQKKIHGNQMKNISLTTGKNLTINTTVDDISVMVDNSISEMQVSYKGTGTLSVLDNGNTTEISVSITSHFFNFGGKGRVMITIPAIQLGKVEVTTVSGDIDLMQDFSAQKIKLHSISGDIDFINLTSKEDVSLSSTSGQIEGEGIDCSSKVEASTISGKIELDLIHASDIYLHTTSSEIQGTVQMEKGEVKATSTSGEIEIDLLQDTPDYRLNAHSTSGSIEVNSTEMGHSVNQDVGKGSIGVTLSTVSGSISLYSTKK
ncbi:MAG: DUF4097 family beta strand repeat-containing protein [Sphaerochaetaceae bacterium]